MNEQALQQEPIQIQREPLQIQQEPIQIQREPLQIQQEPIQIQQEPMQIQQEQNVNQEQLRRSRNSALKPPATPQQLQEQAEREKEKKRKRALRKDGRAVALDKARHIFYSAVMRPVRVWKRVFGSNKQRDSIEKNTDYMQSLQVAYDEMYARQLMAQSEEAAGNAGAVEKFNQEYGEYFRELEVEYTRVRTELRERMWLESDVEEINEEEYNRRLVDELQQRQVTVKMGDSQRADVVGGTKPASVQYGKDGSKWLVKESVSCIGASAPEASIVTEAGYKVQKLVNPDTAIEAFRGQSVGKGIVSYQRMVSGVVNDVDLFRFSRTPDSMTEEELARIEELSPQLLREHTTDWLLCNFDTKGENFVVARDGVVRERVYGIDKEAACRRILDEGAQKMSKDYLGFDQETVYNRLFQKFSDGSMNIELFDVQAQIERVEAMSDDEYMGIFAEYIRQQSTKRPAEEVEKIRENILVRKQNLRMEYREFFTKLVNERCENMPEQADELRRKYFGGPDSGRFLFRGETREVWAREREAMRRQREGGREELDRRAQKADEKDEKTYKRRHALYDFSKSVVMAFAKIKKVFSRREADITTTNISLSEVITQQQHIERLSSPEAYESFLTAYNTKVAELRAAQTQEYLRELQLENEEQLTDEQLGELEARIQRSMESESIEIRMERMHEVHLGGTKPMAEFYAADGSRWLSKQAVNCMGYYKREGVVLTEAGARLQKIVDPATAVDAFVGRTRELGDVSFQRRLENVESGENKLDLFKFSKHPEIATAETIAQVQEIGSQILREHTTDWLLCNFDTKGENFVVTVENGQRVLHGIDKEAAFSKILDPGAQAMSTTFKPHANNTLYNVVFSMYEKGEMDLELRDVLPQIEKIEAMSDEDYLATFKEYFDLKAESTNQEKLEEIRNNILSRKQNLRQDYCDFFTRLVNNRCKTLHPDEAAELKQRYFGADGVRFEF